MKLIQNVPLFSVMLPILCAVLCMPLNQRSAVRLTFFSCTAVFLMSAGLLVHTAHTGSSYIYMMGHFPAPFGNEFRAGPFEALISAVFSAVMLCSVTGGLEDVRLKVPVQKINLFFVMINILLAAMIVLNYTNDLFTSFIFIDIITISASAVICFKPGGKPLIAAMTYLIMSLAGSALVLFSIALLYGVTGHLLMSGLKESISLLAASGRYNLQLFAAAAMMTAGFAVKSALFPFHAWLPDAHSNAVTTASSVLSGLIIKCCLLLLIKLFFRVFGLENMNLLRITDLLTVFGLAGLVWGAVCAARQRSIKRMLSYASVSQIGFISVCIGLGTFEGMAAASYHILVHASAKSMLFCAAGALVQAHPEHSMNFSDLRGTARRVPLAGAAFVIGGFSLIGIPPFSGFFSKMLLAGAAAETRFWLPVILVCVAAGTLLSAVYYLPAIAGLFSRRPENIGGRKKLSFSETAGLWMFMLLNLALGIFSQPVIRLIEKGLTVFS